MNGKMQKRIISIKGDQGFTMVELLVTICIVALGMLALLGFSTQVHSVSRESYDQVVALQDANQVMESLRNLAATGTFPTNVTSVYASGATVAGYSNLDQEAVTISYADATANPLVATVTVNYHANAKRTKSVSLRSKITQRA